MTSYYALPTSTVNSSARLNALISNTTGLDNTANGYWDLYGNTKAA